MTRTHCEKKVIVLPDGSVKAFSEVLNSYVTLDLDDLSHYLTLGVPKIIFSKDVIKTLKKLAEREVGSNGER